MINQTQNSSTALNLTIASNLAAIRHRINLAEETTARPKNSVQLLAVSKTQNTLAIRAAWNAGQRAFGENYLQEALEKQSELTDLTIEWHFIGRIQGNKTQEIATNFSWVHSLSDVRHARRLNAQRLLALPPLNICLQVNISGESSKSGLAPEEVPALIACCLDLPNLCVRGLMAIPESVADPNQQRQSFKKLRQLRDSLVRANLSLDILSMGMSDDLEAAVAEGATMVRIGTAIFGSRNKL